MVETSNSHTPVLLKEVLNFIEANTSKNLTVVDMTVGRGGHSQAILEKLNSTNISYYGIDRDQTALDFCNKHLANCKGNKFLIKSDFASAIDILKANGINGADIILFDIGVSSPQFDNPSRGFSYRVNAPLDMRMDTTQELDAVKVLNNYSEEELFNIIKNYGEERYAKSIAHNIVLQREKNPITMTFELVDIVKKSVPHSYKNKEHHPAKKTFMAIRYEVNKEKDQLVVGLDKALDFLNKGGICMVITFNSLEDGIVKEKFYSKAKEEFVSKYLPPSDKPLEFELLTKKPIAPKQLEIDCNPRSKPSKLRVIKKIL